jgi:pyruvate dehydrogenase E2 component (dihydrolipoamide acetyltransferase)
MGDFTMPSLGADMDVGTLLEWRVRPGDRVRRGDVVAVVDTEKSTIDAEVFEDGVVTELLVDPGQEVPVGTPLARIGPVGASVGEDRPAPPSTPPATPPSPPHPPRPGHVRASPLARRRAAEDGVALADVEGSGPGGAILAADLDRAAEPAPPGAAGPRPPSNAPPAAPAAAPPVPPTPRGDRQASMRRAIAAAMERSNREIPHYRLATTIDLSASLRRLRATNESRPPADRILPAAVLLRATARAAHEVPALNGFWRSDGFEPAGAVHLGVAVSLRGGGLIAPAIHEADRMSLDEVMGALRDVVARARSGRLRSSELADPTITVTNLGDQGADEVHGVIHPPQVALVGFGRIAERPWASDGMLGVRPTVRATLAADHRASDGIVGARFLATLDRLLQTPEDP